MLIGTPHGLKVGRPRPWLANYGRRPGWLFEGVAFDNEFTNNRGWTQATREKPSADFLTTVRASDAYADDTAGNWTLFASGVPRITDKGLLVEEARTNSIRNNSMQGASAPSTNPTNWIPVVAGDAAWAVVGTGTEDGIDYIDLRYTGTFAGSASAIMIFESATGIVATAGQTWTSTFFYKLVGGSTTGVSILNRINYRTVAGASVNNQDVTFTPGATGLGLSRVTNTFLATGGTIERVTNTFGITSTAGSGDVTVRIGWPQLELGAFATSPIRTTSAAATRAADAITAAAPAGLTAYTLFAQGIPQAVDNYAANQVIFHLDDGGANNRGFLSRVTGTVNPASTVVIGGVAVMSAADLGTWNQGVRGKLALAVASGSQRGVFNGGSVVSAAGAGFQTTPSTLRVGSGLSGTVPFNGIVERLAVFPTQLSNAQIQALTQ